MVGGPSVKGSPEDKQPSGPCIKGSAKISRLVTLAHYTGDHYFFHENCIKKKKIAPKWVCPPLSPAISAGSKGVRGTHPFQSNIFIFMQFLAKIMPNNRLMPPSRDWCPEGNPRSTIVNVDCRWAPLDLISFSFLQLLD